MYKDECTFGFGTPLTPCGLFLNLKTWQSYSEEYLELDRERTGNCLYLWEKWHKVGGIHFQTKCMSKCLNLREKRHNARSIARGNDAVLHHISMRTCQHAQVPLAEDEKKSVEQSSIEIATGTAAYQVPTCH